jgi:SPP1 gp7 family putative phage head morphogenesis protein
MTRIARLATLIERDRHKTELLGIRAAARIGLQARLHAVSALRTGHSPAKAARDVLLGNAKMGLSGIAPLIRDALVASHLTGVQRTRLLAAPQFRASDKKKLAITAYDGALEFLQKRLLLSEDDLAKLSQKYHTQALRITGKMATQLETAVQQAIVETTRKGLGVRDGIKALRAAFESEGFTPQANYSLEAVFRTQTQIGYSAGRWQSQQAPEIQDILWGFEYSAVGDDRTTQLCQDLDGMRRPKNDPVWKKLTPPNHWNCRSTAIELYDESTSTDVPDVQAQPGFGLNFGLVFDDPLPAAA